jgi:hypothetical protein
MLYVRSGGAKPLRNFVVGQSATHQINNTKSFVANGKVAGEGSTNWSTSGEGTLVVMGKAGGPPIVVSSAGQRLSPCTAKESDILKPMNRISGPAGKLSLMSRIAARRP